MDFTKLNLEFANMQNTITKYNNLVNEIKNRIKNNLRDISKYETKIKNTKNSLEKESYKLLVISLKNETTFLENIIKEEETNERESGTTKTI
jgi:chromosome segregation ATPase